MDSNEDYDNRELEEFLESLGEPAHFNCQCSPPLFASRLESTIAQLRMIVILNGSRELLGFSLN